MQYSISIHGPKLWNDFINKEEHNIQSYFLFQKKIKSKLIEIENETDYINKTLINQQFSFQSTFKRKLVSIWGLMIRQKTLLQVPFSKPI